MINAPGRIVIPHRWLLRKWVDSVEAISTGASSIFGIILLCLVGFP
jgi:hypothetical protein